MTGKVARVKEIRNAKTPSAGSNYLEIGYIGGLLWVR